MQRTHCIDLAEHYMRLHVFLHCGHVSTDMDNTAYHTHSLTTPHGSIQHGVNIRVCNNSQTLVPKTS